MTPEQVVVLHRWDGLQYMGMDVFRVAMAPVIAFDDDGFRRSDVCVTSKSIGFDPETPWADKAFAAARLTRELGADLYSGNAEQDDYASFVRAHTLALAQNYHGTQMAAIDDITAREIPHLQDHIKATESRAEIGGRLLLCADIPEGMEQELAQYGHLVTPTEPTGIELSEEGTRRVARALVGTQALFGPLGTRQNDTVSLTIVPNYNSSPSTPPQHP